MDLAVSTLSCPDWDLTDIFARFREYGIRNIDLRFVRGEGDLWKLPEFQGPALVRTSSLFSENGIVVSGISTSLKLMDAEVLDKVRQPLDLAAKMGAGYLRVMGGKPYDAEVRRCLEDRLIPGYRALCDSARDMGIDILYETHDPYLDSKQIAEMISRVNRSNAGVVWDVRHPVKNFGESFEHTAGNLRGITRLIHVKDYAGERVVPFGEGEFSPEDLIGCLRDINYDGLLVLEMPNKHNPSLPPPETTLPRFVSIMSPFL